MYANSRSHPASPSSQSVRFTLLAAAMIININRGININHSSIHSNPGITRS